MKKLVLAEDHALAMKKVAIITKGELKIVAEMAAGKSADDIARAMNRSLYTVQNRIYTLRKKTGYRKNTFLVAAFKDQGLIWHVNIKTCRVEVNGVMYMKVLTQGHKYELADFEASEVNNVDVYGHQTIQFIEKKSVTDCRLANHPIPDHLIGPDKLDEMVTVNNGTTNEEVLEMLIDRMKYLQAKFPCKENACCITHLEEGLMWLEKRTRDCIKRGVEGKHTA